MPCTVDIFGSTARLTMGLRKERGQWLVAHEHHSYRSMTGDDLRHAVRMLAKPRTGRRGYRVRAGSFMTVSSSRLAGCQACPRRRWHVAFRSDSIGRHRYGFASTATRPLRTSSMQIDYAAISPDYFRTLDIPYCVRARVHVRATTRRLLVWSSSTRPWPAATGQRRTSSAGGFALPTRRSKSSVSCRPERTRCWPQQARPYMVHAGPSDVCAADGAPRARG